MKKEYIPLLLLAAAIALSPSFSAGTLPDGKIIEIRIEDILIVVLGLVWIASFLVSGKKTVEKPPLLFPILAWLGIGFFSVLTNWIFGNLELSRGFFYFLKEIEFFFLYFYLFYHIKSIDSAKFIIKIWIFLGLINIGWIVYQTITGLELTYYYGPTAFMEPGGPFPSSGFFLILFIFLFNILLFYYWNLNISKFKKGFLGVMVMVPGVGALISGSRTSFWGLLFALFFTFLLGFLRKKNFRVFLASILLIILLSVSFIYFVPTWPGAKRALDIKGVLWEYGREAGPTRINIFKALLEVVSKHPLNIFFGFGVVGEAHSQYMRNLIERGIIGSLVFFCLIFIIIKKSWQGFSKNKDAFSISLSAGLLIATLTMLLMSIPTDPFMVVKVAEVYWFFVALTMATLSFKLKESN